MELRRDRQVVVLDTSALVQIFVHVARGGAGLHRFRKAVGELWRPNVQFVFHPITLAELATNSHEEVLHGRMGHRGPRPASEIALRAQAHKQALVALRACVEGRPLTRDFAFRVLPLVPDWRDYVAVASQREDYKLLRCTAKSSVVPVAGLTDHQILSVALSLIRDGYDAGFISGDRELLGAAERFGLPLLYVHGLDDRSGFRWKDCNQDDRCIVGCSDGVAECIRMFQGP